MKYKVGDKIRIKSLGWYNYNKGNDGCIHSYKECSISPEMTKYLGKEATIVAIKEETAFDLNPYYNLDIDNKKYNWNDYMFEEKPNKKIILPKGWEIDKVEGGEIILKESKRELPKTWEECIAKVENLEFINRIGDIEKAKFDLQVAFNHRNDVPKGLSKSLLALCQLLVCREVYRQGWKPNWKDNTNKFYIYYIYNQIMTCSTTCTNFILSFQSKEIRDEFLENFQDLIEEAKELL